TLRETCRRTQVELERNRVIWGNESGAFGVPCDVYRQERHTGSSQDECFCAGPAKLDSQGLMRSQDCVCARVDNGCSHWTGLTREPVPTDGAVAYCYFDWDVQRPVCSHAAPLAAEHITVINGREDLFIQHCWGKALVEVYNQAPYDHDRAHLCTFPGRAGHGVLLQEPGWVNQRIASAIDGEWSGCTLGQVQGCEGVE
ncbi:MAG: hypothetical protein MI919_22710, partial [Holophagales bacterium]|nr:hypothetical protein [Holophagales bacterium]